MNRPGMQAASLTPSQPFSHPEYAGVGLAACYPDPGFSLANVA